MEVLQRKTGRHLGSTTLEEIRGKCFVVAIRQMSGFKSTIVHFYGAGLTLKMEPAKRSYTTTIKFRIGILYNASQSKDEQYLIAYGFRDASLLPGFKPSAMSWPNIQPAGISI